MADGETYTLSFVLSKKGRMCGTKNNKDEIYRSAAYLKNNSRGIEFIASTNPISAHPGFESPWRHS